MKTGHQRIGGSSWDGKVVFEGDGGYSCKKEEDYVESAPRIVPNAVIPSTYHSFVVKLLQGLGSVRDGKGIPLWRWSAKWRVRFHTKDRDTLLAVDWEATGVLTKIGRLCTWLLVLVDFLPSHMVEVPSWVISTGRWCMDIYINVRTRWRSTVSLLWMWCEMHSISGKRSYLRQSLTEIRLRTLSGLF